MSASAPNNNGGERNESENYAAKIEELDTEIEDLVGHSSLQGVTEEERNEFYRKRNALYSQRKYYRKKMRIERLETERDGLIAKNANVRSQNEVLERMLHWAIEKVQLYELLVARNPASAVALTASPEANLESLLESISGAKQSTFAPSYASFPQTFTGMPSIPTTALGLSGSGSSLRNLSLAAASLPTSHSTQLDQLLREQQQADLLGQLVAAQGLPALGPSLTGRHGSDASALRTLGASLPTNACFLASTVGSQLPQLSNAVLLGQQQQQQQNQQSELLHLLNLQRSAGGLGNFAISSIQPRTADNSSSLLQYLQASTGDISEQVLQAAFVAQQANRVSGGGRNVNAPKSAPGNEAAASPASKSSSSDEDRKLPAHPLPPKRPHF